jgi:endonuclease/exonuclease/phosphatase family metal-dependent hydrolase
MVKHSDLLKTKLTGKYLDFYTINNDNIIPDIKYNEDDILICSYNIRCFINLNPDIDTKDNVNNILSLLKVVNPHILILEEFNDFQDRDNMISAFKKLGYTNMVIAKNGDEVEDTIITSYVVVLSKDKINNVSIIDLTVYNHWRQCIYFEYNNIKIIAVHLEIGERFHHLNINSKERNNIIDKNTKLRTKQLTTILKWNPDIIIGDFNFMPSDNEFTWLLNNGYSYHEDYNNTTPFNRVDLAFVNDNCQYGINKVWTIKCNYSDHLPVVYSIGTVLL